MDKQVKDFLEGLVHGPTAHVTYHEYEKWVREKAKQLLKESKELRPGEVYAEDVDGNLLDVDAWFNCQFHKEEGNE